MRAATRTNNRRAAIRLRTDIERLYKAAARARQLLPSARARALCAMAACAMFYESAEEGQGLLRECAPLEREIEPSLVHRIRLLRGVTHLRLAQWDFAEYESRQALALIKPKNDVLQTSSVLNNLVCCALERGDWDRAQELIDQVHRLTEALSPAFDASLPVAVNAANVSFYRGQAEQAMSMYMKALKVAKENHMEEFLLELEACVGLTALQTGNRNLVEESWSALKDVDDAQLQGIQERFKVEWFRTYLLRNSDSAPLWDRLTTLGRELERIDRPSHLKILWLRAILLSRRELAGRSDLLLSMKEVSLGWFARFSERWLRSTNSRRWSVVT